MRVVAGYLGGRNFDAPRGHRTHPMGDKIRGALFNTLGDISGLTVFDPYSGSGAISVEAVSRGASSVLALDIDKTAYLTVQSNIKALNIGDKVQIQRANAGAWARRNTARVFDIVIADPPYDDIDRTDLKHIAMRVKQDGIVVLSLPPTEGLTMMPDSFEQVAKKSYGDAELHFYRRQR